MNSAEPRTDDPPRLTFSLATAGFVIAVICVLLAEYQALGRDAIFAWGFTLSLSGLAFAIWRKMPQLRSLSIVALVMLMIAACCLPLGMLDYHGGGSLHSYCSNNLRQVAIAAHNYHDVYQTFPLQQQPDATGKPGLSWRVSLLPFIEEDALYRQFDLQQAWDRPANRALAAHHIRLYHCPAETNNRGNETSYVAIAGDDTCWPASKPIELRAIRDGSSNTILFAETHDSGIAWPEPRDLEYDKLDWRLQGTPGNSISSSHGPRVTYFDGSSKLKQRTDVNVVMADGSTHRLSRDIDPEVLRQMVHRRDGLPKELP
jgi:hypothetical protein